VKGLIQHISAKPFYTTFSNEAGVWLHHSMANNGLVHCDATGSIVASSRGSAQWCDELGSKRLLYYAVVVQHPQKGQPPIAVAEMVSSSHTCSGWHLSFLACIQICRSWSISVFFPQHATICCDWSKQCITTCCIPEHFALSLEKPHRQTSNDLFPMHAWAMWWKMPEGMATEVNKEGHHTVLIFQSYLPSLTVARRIIGRTHSGSSASVWWLTLWPWPSLSTFLNIWVLSCTASLSVQLYRNHTCMITCPNEQMLSPLNIFDLGNHSWFDLLWITSYHHK
jgi:hypothetical protein